MHDPGLRALRRAARTAITATPAFYFGLFVVDDPQFAVLAVFTCIGVNGRADFGGPNASRLLANVALVATGVPLVALGTWVSESTAEATILMFAVVFLVGYTGIYSGYVAAGANVVILFYVVASAIPAPASDIDARVLGLLFGGALAVPASVLLWPVHERATFRTVLAGAVHALGEALASAAAGRGDADWARRRHEARRQVEGVRPALAQMTLRPAGPTSRDRGEIYVVYALDRLDELLDRLGAGRAAFGAGDRGRELASLATALDAAASTLAETGPGGDVETLRRATDAFVTESDKKLCDALTAGAEPARFNADAEADMLLRELGAIVVIVSVNAGVAAGRRVPSAGGTNEPGTPMLDPTGLGVLTVAWRRARANFTLSSVVLRNSLRLATGLAVARLLVGIVDLEHGFWVVFGTLTVMKSTAGGTRATVIRAVGGTAIGFAVAAVLLVSFEGDHDIWIVLMPFALAGAMYAFGKFAVVGPALFTLTIVVLFRVMAPATWTLALLRLEDVAIGAGIGLLIGVLAWPRGAGGQLRVSLANLIDAGRRYAALTARELLSGTNAPHDVAGARDATIGATHRAEDVFMQFLTERGARRVPLPVWGALLAGGLRLWYSADTIRLRATGTAPGSTVCLELVGLLEQAIDRLDAGFAETASALRVGSRTTVAPPLPPETSTGPVVSECIERFRHETDATRLAQAMRLIEVRAWLRLLSDELAGLAAPVGEVTGRLGSARR